MKYKRKLIEGETVRVHKNLNNGKWSISARIPKKGFQVVAHLDTVTLLNVTPKISQAGIKRIRTKKVRAVVAYLEGTFTFNNVSALSIGVFFNPYKNTHFVSTRGEFTTANLAHFAPNSSHFTIN
tara:strand:- start:690 stop:1064 length:375 start_codon:yes stop_codon:yes gene_type:complete